MKSCENINFFKENVSYRLSNQLVTKQWLNKVILQEKKKLGEINIVLCDDKYLLTINKNYLQHDYFTDIITFDYGEKKLVSGDIFISIDRIKENAQQYKKTTANELKRIMVHGVLHLCGYTDKTKAAKATMTAKEDYYLSLLLKIKE